MSQILVLYRLQKIDLDLDARRLRVREINAALKQDSVLRQAREDVTAIQDQLRPEETRVTDLNLEIQAITHQSKQLNDRLYGGQVGNPKELQDIENKIAELKRRHADRENTLLETMIQVEELQTSLAEVTERLNQIEAEWAAQQESLTNEQHQLKREIKTLKADREATIEQIAADHLELYQTLRTTKRGVAVAVLEGEMCSGCGVGQTANIVQQVRQEQELVMCSSCGRILIAL